MKNQIYNDDCFKILPKLPDNSIELILCDLPYNTTACQWDCELDLEKLWVEFKRLLTPYGNIVLTAQQPFTWKLCSSNPKMFRYELIWEKPNSTNPFVAKYQPLKVHENILIFNRNKKPIYNPQMTTGNPYVWNSKRSKGQASSLTSEVNDKINNEGTRYPRSVQKFKQERGLHPTQKSIEMFSWLIRTYSNKNDTVLDCCAGSGTTAISALETNRNYICIEKETEYFDIIQDRIYKFEKQEIIPEPNQKQHTFADFFKNNEI